MGIWWCHFMVDIQMVCQYPVLMSSVTVNNKYNICAMFFWLIFGPHICGYHYTPSSHTVATEHCLVATVWLLKPLTLSTTAVVKSWLSLCLMLVTSDDEDDNKVRVCVVIPGLKKKLVGSMAANATVSCKIETRFWLITTLIPWCHTKHCRNQAASQ